MLTEDNGAGWGMHRWTVHLLFRHGVELFRFGLEPVVPIRETFELASSESAERLLFRGAVHSSIQRAHHDENAIVREGLMYDCVSSLRCCCVWDVGGWKGRDGAKRIDNRELIHGEMNRVVAWAIVKRDISLRGKKQW